MFHYEKWVAPCLLVFSTVLKIGSIITLYSVYAHSGNTLHPQQQRSVMRASKNITHLIKSNLVLHKSL